MNQLRRLPAPLHPLTLSLLVLAGCSGVTPDSPLSDNGPDRADEARATFVYVLQPEGVDFDDLVDSRFAYVVIEPSTNGSAGGEFSADQIQTLRTAGPCGQKTVLAYLSIGEAESYRSYWDPAWSDTPGDEAAPAWLGPANPDFEGNYKVRYWDATWQELILGTDEGPDQTPLDRIIEAGYDGVYLDIIDAYEFWSSEAGDNELTRA